MFRRTTHGLSNLALFYGVDLIFFTEGGDTAFSKQDVMSGSYSEHSDDINFWNKVLQKNNFKKTVQFRAIGSKTAGDEICDLIVMGQVQNICLARDSDLDYFFGRRINSPLVLYTRGYSWENDVYNRYLLRKLLRSTMPASVTFDEIEPIINECYRKFDRNVSRITYAEIMFRKEGKKFITTMAGERFLPNRGKVPHLKIDQVLKLIADNKHHLLRPVSSNVIYNELCCIRHTYGKLIESFFHALLNYINKEFLKLRSTVSKDYLKRLILNMYSEDISLEDTEYYLDIIRRLEAA